MPLLIMLSCLVCSSAFAATRGFHIESEIELDGIIVAKPNFKTLPGSRATLSPTADDRVRSVEVVVQDDLGPARSDAIMMKFKIAINRNGEQKIHEPTIIARPGKAAEMAVGNSNGKELFRLKVVAKRELE